MKTFITILAAIFGFAFAAPAGALVPGAHISSVTRIDEGNCAVTIVPSGSLLDILPTDKLTLEGNVLATLASLLELDLDSADEVLAATTSFEELVGLDADIQLDPEDCVEMFAGNQLELVDTLTGVVDSVELPEGFGNLTSLVLDENGNLKLLNLLDESTQVENSDGDTGSVGGGAGGIGGDGAEEEGGSGARVGALPDVGGGCALSPGLGVKAGDTVAWLTAAALLSIGAVRRRGRKA
ncbi:hypothetical protein FBR05_09555 [Deltaproteobacteria bacterium PRO3]|nr:hypothetical protein [Deltaproteobacteria bacterium PRO3]